MKKLVCELCGSNDFTKDNEGLFVCDFCRTKYTPEQAQKLMVEGVVQIDRSGEVNNLTVLASTALEHGNIPEAEKYALSILEIDSNSPIGWLIKGKAAGHLSTLENLRLDEMMGAFRKALELSDPESREAMQIDCANHITNTASRVNNLSYSEMMSAPTVGVGSPWVEPALRHFARSVDIISLLQTAHAWGAGRLPLDYIIIIATNLVQKSWRTLTSSEINRGKNRVENYRAQMQPVIDDAAEKIRAYDPSYLTPRPRPQRHRSFSIG